MAVNALDALGGKAYNIVSMTNSINLAPVNPQAIGKAGVFSQEGIQTYQALVEYRNGVFTILPYGQRGELGAAIPDVGRVLRSFPVPHIPQLSTIQVHEIIGVRKFGSQDEMETLPDKVTEHLAQHATNHESTWEFHRAAAMCGLVKNSDGATVTNIYTEFGLTEDSFTFNFSAGTEAALHAKCIEVKLAIGTAIGGTGICAVGALVDDVFFNAMIASAGVRSAWSDDVEFKRKGYDTGEDVFVWGGIEWKRYRANIGSSNFFGTTNVARFYPKGVDGIFKHYMAPANMGPAVNTIGLPMYASQLVLPHEMGVQIHSQSNPFFVCLRPAALKKGVST